MENVTFTNLSLTKDFKSYYTSFIQKRFQERCENTNKSSLQNIYICNLNSKFDFASCVSYKLSSPFLQSQRRSRRTEIEGREHFRKGVDEKL